MLLYWLKPAQARSNRQLSRPMNQPQNLLTNQRPSLRTNQQRNLLKSLRTILPKNPKLYRNPTLSPAPVLLSATEPTTNRLKSATAILNLDISDRIRSVQIPVLQETSQPAAQTQIRPTLTATPVLNGRKPTTARLQRLKKR